MTMEFKEFNDLEELLMTYSKACDGDRDIRSACDHLVAVFKAAMLEDDPLKAFVGQLKKDASYASWKGPEPSPSCPWCFKRIASPVSNGWSCPCGKNFNVTEEDQAEATEIERRTPRALIERAAKIIADGSDDTSQWFEDYWATGGQVNRDISDLPSVDGVVLVAGDRKVEEDPAGADTENGIYKVTSIEDEDEKK